MSISYCLASNGFNSFILCYLYLLIRRSMYIQINTLTYFLVCWLRIKLKQLLNVVQIKFAPSSILSSATRYSYAYWLPRYPFRNSSLSNKLSHTFLKSGWWFNFLSINIFFLAWNLSVNLFTSSFILESGPILTIFTIFWSGATKIINSSMTSGLVESA